MRNERFEQALLKLDEVPLEDYRKNEIKPLLALLRERFHLKPMTWVLDRVPGETVLDRAKRVGISRNTWYKWCRGEVRPNRHQAKRLEELTGIPAAQFAGRR